MVRLSSPNSNLSMLMDSDFVHPTKLTQFYECDEYKAYLKGEQKSFFETRDRQILYKSILKYIYTIVDEDDEFEFRKKIMGVRVKGFNGDKKPTEAMFLNHLTCEITFSNKHYFLIDDSWYTVKGDFIKTINDQCLQLIKRNHLTFSPLEINWKRSEYTEGEYNLLYLNRPKYYILDKIIAQNIELCDIIYETHDAIYLIHVKENFDAKIRDLANQISISAKRLWNDLKSDKAYINSIYKQYSTSKNNIHNLSWDDFENLFKKEIIYVMAFTSSYKGKSVLENFESHKSNIAKFSVIQSFREQSENYQLQVFEIEYN